MRDGQQTTSEDSATQLLICEALSLAIILEFVCLGGIMNQFTRPKDF